MVSNRAAPPPAAAAEVSRTSIESLTRITSSQATPAKGNESRERGQL